MPLDPSVIRRMAHDTLKPLEMVQMYLEMIASGSDRAFQHPEAAKVFLISVEHIQKVLEDMSTLAIAEQPEEQRWETVDWTAFVKNQFSSLKRKPAAEWRLTEAALKIKGESHLLERSLKNLYWFATHFSNRLERVSLASGGNQRKPEAELSYDIEAAAPVLAGFDEKAPFSALSESSSALDSNTGLIFFTVQKVAELHGGLFQVQAEARKITLRFTLPANTEASTDEQG